MLSIGLNTFLFLGRITPNWCRTTGPKQDPNWLPNKPERSLEKVETALWPGSTSIEDVLTTKAALQIIPRSTWVNYDEVYKKHTCLKTDSFNKLRLTKFIIDGRWWLSASSTPSLQKTAKFAQDLGSWLSIHVKMPDICVLYFSDQFLVALAALYLRIISIWLSHWWFIIQSNRPMSGHSPTFLTKPLKSWEQTSSHFGISTLFYLAVRILPRCFLWVRKLKVIWPEVEWTT